MTVATDLIAPLRQHLGRNTSPDLAVAFQQMPHFCRKFFALERLVDLLRKEAPILRTANVFDVLRDEVVRRLLVTADRARWQATALELLRLEGLADPVLLRFVERCYRARAADFAVSEGEFLKGLQEVYEAHSPLRGPVYDALAWFAALPEHSGGPRFRVLFSSQSHHGQFPNVFVPGVCVSFSFTKANSTEPFARYDVERLGSSFRRAAEEAEIKGYELCGKTFGATKHRRVRIEDNLEDLSVLDGTSGYLSFLMIHVCLMRGIPLSPYVAFTGSFKDFQRLDTVADLPHKVTAAIDAGMRLLFVPEGNYAALSDDERQARGLLRIVPYDEHMSIERVAELLASQLLSLQAELTPAFPAVPAAGDQLPTSAGRPPDSEPVPISEPQKLFKATQLGCFIECGGYDRLQSPAKMSAFNSEDDCFISIFPGKRRVYRFDSFGALCEKFRSEAMPLCIAWNEDGCEYVIGFDDGQIRRFNARLEAAGSWSLPEPAEPRLLACGNGAVYVGDRSERIVRLDRNGNATHRVVLKGKVCHLAFCETRRCLIASTAGCLVGLDSELRILWQIDHFAPRSTATGSPSGGLWVALSSGHLWRLGRDNERLVDVAVPSNVWALAALEGAVAVGTLQGQIQIYDMLGRKLGGDDLEASLYHACATEGDMLVLSTAKGPTVVKPRPELSLSTREQAVREQAHASLLEWERAAQSGASLHRVVKEDLRRMDLARWQEVCALQGQLLQRRTQQPVLYEKIETAIRFVDPRKAARLCVKTRPVIIDGSNVSRHHWNNERKAKRRARLAAILRLREKLAGEANPVLYPLIVVVDVTERHYTDDLACLKRMIDDGEILETPSAREADALILNLVRTNRWLECHIVSNDRRLFDAHAEMLPGADRGWYERVRMAFTINPRTHEVYFPERSDR